MRPSVIVLVVSVWLSAAALAVFAAQRPQQPTVKKYPTSLTITGRVVWVEPIPVAAAFEVANCGNRECTDADTDEPPFPGVAFIGRMGGALRDNQFIHRANGKRVRITIQVLP